MILRTCFDIDNLMLGEHQRYGKVPIHAIWTSVYMLDPLFDPFALIV